jgi:5'-3' exonuclease
MGIPSYFAYLLRHHKRIVKRYAGELVDNLYLDSNSIVYDVVRTLPYPSPDFDARLIQAVCEKLQFYLDFIQPKRVFIAFDGVPPMAKMKQQRERRYKSLLHAEPGPPTWNTVQITPGTKFMHALDAGLRAYFEPRAKTYTWFKLSTSEEPGEGEHKIFEHMRQVSHADQTTLVYGLDSDLIILALNHLEYGRISLLREAPAFKSKEGGLHVLDVALLASEIRAKMGATKLQDYIFLTLFLGNDFMPHFPALNLRTTGFDTLLQTYRACVAPHEHLFRGSVQWPVVYKLIAALAKREQSEIVREYKSRARPVEDTAVNTPMLKREVEHYINPLESQWETRYYAALFQSERSVARQASECFLQMLDWNMRYYTTGCPSWTVYYPYMYPPLLVDLVKCKFKDSEELGAPVSGPQLLEFVLPEAYATLALQPYTPKERVPECYWAFCTFLWESHLLF